MLDIARKTPESVSHTIVSGTAYNGTDAIPVIAQAPGYLPSPWGSEEAIFERLVLDDQLHANMIAGRVVANANREVVDVNVPLAGNWLPALDIAPQNWVQMNVQPEDNKRGISLEGYYHLRNITSEINVKGGVCLADITLVPEAFGPDGVPGPYPDDWPWPTFPLPDFPEFPPWAFPRWDTLMVRNCFALPPSYYVKTPVYQGTVINDPSSILPASNGAEIMNTLYATDNAREPEVVTDGIVIYFHQYDIAPTDYRPRIYRHDIATGAADYLELPNSRMEEGSLTVIDIGVVAAVTIDATGETVTLHRIDFIAGTVTAVYSYHNANRDTTVGMGFCLTMQSTLNVYTVFDVLINDGAGDISQIIFCRCNWTTGASDESVVWENTIGQLQYMYMFCAPVIVDYEMYVFYSPTYYISAPQSIGRKSFIIHYNFSLATSGYTQVLLTGTNYVPILLKAAPYYELNRIYFQVAEGFEPWHDGHIYYISTLTKELTYTETFDLEDVTFICDKNKCWRMDWSQGPGHSKVIDPFTGEERWLGISDSGENQYWPIRSRLAWCVDDIDETIYTFLGDPTGLIISNRLEDVIINDTGITAISTRNYRLLLLGRTFVIVQIGGTYDYEAWVVHYPGSLVM